MKIIVIPDMHGSEQWRTAIKLSEEHPDYYVVALGDWVDSFNSYWPQQGDNLIDALNWFREDKEHRFFLIGNHDWAYMTGTDSGKHVSGHQWYRALIIRHILESNKDIIYVAKEFDGWVFSHAGFSKTWVQSMEPLLEDMNGKSNEEHFSEKETEYLKLDVELLNQTFQRLTHFPDVDNYSESFDLLLDWRGYSSLSGNEKTQGPLWIRPGALLEDSYFDKQIVGHTEMTFYEPTGIVYDGVRLLLADSPSHDGVFIFDTENPGRFFTTDELGKIEKDTEAAMRESRKNKLTWEDTREKLIEAGASEKACDVKFELEWRE